MRADLHPEHRPLPPRFPRALFLGLAATACTPSPPDDQAADPQAVMVLEASRHTVSVAAGQPVASAIVAATPHDPAARPVLNGLPAHLALTIPIGTGGAPVPLRLLALPVAGYRRHYLGGARAGFDRRLGALRDIIAAGRLAVDGEVPVFPQPGAAQRFRARLHWIRFDGGEGVAFVTQFSDDASPPAAEELVWVFQGLTDDGAWLLSMIQPLVVTGLPASEDARRVARAVDSLPARAITPDPAALTAAVSALRVEFPPIPSGR